jgi:hypothetical protein
MIKKLALILAASLLLSAAEIAYINSSPLLGEADSEDLILSREAAASLSGGSIDSELNGQFSGLYGSRPHVRDPAKVYFKFAALGSGVLDTMSTGVVLWKIGVFNPESLGNLSNGTVYARVVSEYSPKAVASGFYPEAGLFDSSRPLPESWGPGRRLAVMQYGWLILMDQTFGAPLVLFDERFSRGLNMSHEEFISAYSGVWRTSFARASFVESVLDEKPPWGGIYYLSYYPKFRRIFVVVKSVPSEELLDARVLVDGAPAGAEMHHPFIFVDADLPEGSHRLDLLTSSGSYGLDFVVEQSTILAARHEVSLGEDGKASIHLMNLDPVGRRVYVKDAVFSAAGKEAAVEVGSWIDQYAYKCVEAQLGALFEDGKEYEVNVSVNYSVDGIEKKYEWIIWAEAGKYASSGC